MKLGVDFGTTRIVVAGVDRGNYPVVASIVLTGRRGTGSLRSWPSGQERRYGFEAWQAQEEPGWTVVRSREALARGSRPGHAVAIGGQVLSPCSTCCGSWRRRLRGPRERSTLTRAARPSPWSDARRPGQREQQPALPHRRRVPPGWGARARRLERALGREHRVRSPRADRRRCDQATQPARLRLRRRHVRRVARRPDDQVHEVVDSEGLSSLGGDDFDEVLAEMALESAGVKHEEQEGLSQDLVFRLYELCRTQKEALHPNTRRIVIDLEAINPSWPSVTVPVAEFYERCQPMVERTFASVEAPLRRQGFDEGDEPRGGRLETVYAIGGASELPVVGRRLSERLRPARPKRSSYGRSPPPSAWRSRQTPRRATSCGIGSRGSSVSGARATTGPRRFSIPCLRGARRCRGPGEPPLSALAQLSSGPQPRPLPFSGVQPVDAGGAAGGRHPALGRDSVSLHTDTGEPRRSGVGARPP